MTRKNYTHITFVVDRSGSMVSLKKDAEGGINTFFNEQKKVKGKCTYSIYQFDTTFETVASGKDISEFETYHLIPAGGTALYDAQWNAINLTGKFLRDLPEKERPSKVIFITVTDGEENSSREIYGPAGLSKLKKLVQQQETDYSWEFIYIGANQDAFAVGQSFGVSRSMTYAGTGASTAGTYANLTYTVSNARTTGMDTSAFLAANVDENGNMTFNNTSANSNNVVTGTFQPATTPDENEED